MGFFASLFAQPAVDAIGAIGNTFDQLFTSDDERAEAEMVMMRIRQQPHILQAEINRIESGHRTLFVAGWRPFIGWVCGMGLLWAFIGHPMFEWTIAIMDLQVAAPDIATDNMLELVLALLGLGGLRTFEKLGGRAK